MAVLTTSAENRLRAFTRLMRNDLITEKLATGRPKDIGDVDELLKLKDRNAD